MSVSQTSTAPSVSAPLRELPAGPKGSWLFGNLSEFRRDILGFYSRCAQEYGDVVPYRLGFQRLCLLNHPDFTEQVLITDGKHFGKKTYILKLLEPVLGKGLLTSDGDLWLRQRRLIQPAFHRQRIQTYGQVMVEYTLRMLDRWQHGEARDLHAEMMRLALEIVGKTLFDADVASDASEVGVCMEVVMDQFIRRWESVVPVPDWFPSPTNLRFRRTLKQLNAIIYRMIAQRRSQPQERGDLLSILLHARDENDGAGMSDEQLRDEAMTIFLAGHETTANALSWTWYLLTQNPAEENKLLDELTAVLNGRPPTVADLSQLVFTERVLMESMRLYPPAYGFGRIALADCNIGGFRVPRGTNIILCPWVSHRDGRWFDEPLAFRPERWSNELAKRLPRYAYFPFGGGPRICIGNSFAMMEATLILATIAQRYHFRLRPDPPVVPHAYVTLRPGHGIPVTLAKR